MDFVVNKIEAISGSIRVPGDKSISHRSIILGSISKGTTYIQDILLSEDVQRTISFFESLGVSITHKSRVIALEGMDIQDFRPYAEELDMGNSGTSARLLLGLASGSTHSYTLNGDPFLRKRPMKRVTEPLEKMGAHIEFLEREDRLPIKIKGGNLQGIHYKLPVASAQIKSALILAGLHCSGKTVIEESVATRDHTEIMIQHFGGKIEKNNHCIQIEGYYHDTNRAGGIEAGVSNGEDIIVRGYMKPIPTLMKPLKTVDMETKEEKEAIIERSDNCAVPSAAVVAEAICAFAIAKEFLEKFRGDSIEEVHWNYKRYMNYLRSR